jgi:hypothetical protein
MLIRDGRDWLEENIAAHAGLAQLRQVSDELLYTLQ